ncbi:selenide, water dikinase SelD [Gymnodinialimonas ceratoperidinii]|uniref:Selenide, water dikinase SelD n=1 Tax=Gymnodinialimonas ceratoperidinii TaxID=2856823 RepID=A0A8F6TZQ1_9RHOB|nr:selenide, water dikinase SelD [Gymnodinialimonas ceratoperidinii]QXT40681.1 selenide, water dikinase SelD [Gymnodinialimonas ceratoperidinii]
MTPATPIVKELVLLGGGHTHALVLRKWGMKPVPGVRLTLVNPGPTAPYSGMLPGHLAGHYAREALDIDLVRLARFAEARLLVDRAVAVDPAAKVVRLGSGREVSYDLLSFDVGITSEMPTLPGFAEHGVAAKPLGRFAGTWARICAESGPIAIAIIGGGVAGCEVAMAAAHRMRSLGREARVSVIDRGEVLTSVVPAARQRLLQGLSDHGVSLKEGVEIASVASDAVVLTDGTRIASDLTIGAAGATPQGWIAESGLPCKDGFLVVDAHLRSPADPAIFGAGDCVHLSHDPRPKAGVYAVRAAPILAHNLRAALLGQRSKPFRPQKDFLKLVSLGGKRAVAEKRGLAVSGGLMWQLKNRIDQTFMDKFRELPEMPLPKAPKGAALGVAEEMAGPVPCGGCGAKLASGALQSVLAQPAGASRPDVEAVPGDDAAVLRMGEAAQVISTDHLRGFALDPALVARAAAVHALGDIWAMGATPQAALAQVILPRVEARLQGRWLDEVMAAAGEIFAAEGVAVVGGHSSGGSELTVGFTVTGLLERPAITLRGARPGDALVLTKPLGTGVILAAEMQMKAEGAAVLACWQSMTTPSGAAARALAPVAHAMTDVTGFGLAGHLANICSASGVGAEVTLADVPLLPGAEALAAQGIRSSLWAQNRASVPADAPATSRADLMFDPQTAGGLLAAIPAEAVGTIPGATRIGTVTETPGLIFR